jgi:hypothetical protein
MHNATGHIQAMIQVAVLPGRAAYLIAARSSAGFRRAVQEASTRWGGATEPIIPVSKSGVVHADWRRVIQLSNIDGLVNVDAHPKAAQTAALSLGLPLVDLRYVDHDGVTRLNAHPTEVVAQRVSKSPDSATMATTSGDLWEIAAAGDLTDEHLSSWSFGTPPDFYPYRASTADQVGRAQIFCRTLLDRTLSQFGENSVANGPLPSPAVVWVTAPNNFADCLAFWNLRALRPLDFAHTPMVLLPHREVMSWVNFSGNFSSVLRRPESIEPDAVVCSLNVDEQSLHKIAMQLGLQPSTKKRTAGWVFPPRPTKEAPFSYRVNLDSTRDFLFERTYGRSAHTLVHLYPGRTTIRVDSPVQFCGGGKALLRLSSDAFDGLPRRSSVARLVGENFEWSGSSLQMGVQAQNVFHLELAIPALQEAAWSTLRSSADASLSDKGKLATRVDDFAVSDVLMKPGVLTTIRDLTTPRSKELERELTTKRELGHPNADLAELAASWGGRVERRFRPATELKTKGASQSAAEALAAVSWAERGFAVKCSLCLLRSFVPLAETTSSPQCPACKANQQYEGSGEPAVHYRLNPVIDRASDQGVMPHLAALAVLRKRRAHTFLFPGIDVKFPDGTKNEVDLYGVHDGLIVAGEAKTSSKDFTLEQIKRDVDLSSRLNADIHLVVSNEVLNDAVVNDVVLLTNRADLKALIIEGTEVRSVE